jgi:hypothetical protein
MWELMIQVAVSEKNNYITSYLSECDESVTALKILTENRQRTEPTDLPKPRV